jgi:hypothetical protein
MRRRILELASFVSLAVVLAVPAAAAAATSQPFEFTDQRVVEHSCGIVEDLTVTGRGRAYFAADGSWQRDIIHLTYESAIQSTITGTSIDARSTQVLEVAPDSGIVRGQGFFIRIPGEGVVVRDMGRLVFDTADGSTITASAQAIGFDDVESLEAAEAALCSLLS